MYSMGSLSFSGVIVWNSIPVDIKNSLSLDVFVKGVLLGLNVNTCIYFSTIFDIVNKPLTP